MASNLSLAHAVRCFHEHVKPMVAQLPNEHHVAVSYRNNEVMPLSINSLCAKFFRGNINMYLHFMSFLHTEIP